MSDPGIQPATVKQYCGMLSTYRLVVSSSLGSPVARVTKHPDFEKAQQEHHMRPNQQSAIFWSDALIFTSSVLDYQLRVLN